MKSLSWLCAVTVWLGFAFPVCGAGGRVVKVLPEFLDREGRTSLSPSLYERDAYQAQLRLHPERRSGLRFYIEWKTKGPHWQPLKLQLELRGRAEGNLPKELVIDTPLVNKRTSFTRWTEITLTNQQYQHLGAITAWRATIWEGNALLGEQRSFLW